MYEINVISELWALYIDRHYGTIQWFNLLVYCVIAIEAWYLNGFGHVTVFIKNDQNGEYMEIQADLPTFMSLSYIFFAKQPLWWNPTPPRKGQILAIGWQCLHLVPLQYGRGPLLAKQSLRHWQFLINPPDFNNSCFKGHNLCQYFAKFNLWRSCIGQNHWFSLSSKSGPWPEWGREGPKFGFRPENVVKCQQKLL